MESDGLSKSVVVHMPSSRNGRRFALVSSLLTGMKIQHTALFGLLRRFQLKGLEAKATQSPFCRVTSRKPKQFDVLITDQAQSRFEGKTIQISYDFMDALKHAPKPDTLFLPILFHPNLLTKTVYNKAEQLSKNSDRPIGILFAGNCDPKTYDNELIGKVYGLANRHELFQVIRSLSSDLMFIPDTKQAFDQALESGELINKMVWIDTERFRIPQAEWLELLAKSRYFFCTPGVHYPYCQNLNEAAACGSVPILQYPDFYQPALKDAENCLAFKEALELEELFKSAIKSENQPNWKKQSNSAVEWHQNHMSLAYIQKELSQFLNDPSRTHLTWILAGKQ